MNPVLFPPGPLIDFVLFIGAIKAVPPKLTTPPETVPIMTPSFLKAKFIPPKVTLRSLYVQAGMLVHIMIIRVLVGLGMMGMRTTSV